MTFDLLAHVNRAVSAGWLVLAVLGLRLLLKKAPRRFHCLLWALAALRLVLPVSIPSDLSLQPSAAPVVQQVVLPAEVSLPAAVQPVLQSGVPLLDDAVNPILSHAAVPVTGASATDWTAIFGWVWAAGVGLMLLYLLLSYLRLRRQVREASPMEGRVWQCDHIATPFILGVFRPRIYLPSDLPDADAVLVLAHEQAHLRRGDHIWKPLGFLLLTLYWFHPLLWLGYILLCRDIELACDEKVLEKLGTEHKKAYSGALINCSAPRRMLTACPVAFGESDIRQRVKAALHYKKPAFWLLLAASAAVLATAVCFLTDPKRTQSQPLTNGETAVVVRWTGTWETYAQSNAHYAVCVYEVLDVLQGDDALLGTGISVQEYLGWGSEKQEPRVLRDGSLDTEKLLLRMVSREDGSFHVPDPESGIRTLLPGDEYRYTPRPGTPELRSVSDLLDMADLIVQARYNGSYETISLDGRRFARCLYTVSGVLQGDPALTGTEIAVTEPLYTSADLPLAESALRQVDTAQQEVYYPMLQPTSLVLFLQEESGSYSVPVAEKCISSTLGGSLNFMSVLEDADLTLHNGIRHASLRWQDFLALLPEPVPQIPADDDNFFAQAVDLSGGVFTPRGFDFYTPDVEVLSALSLDKSALTEERENTGVILLRGQTLGFANGVDVRYDFYLGRLHSVRYQVTVPPGEIDNFRARLAEQAAYLPDPADPEKTVEKLKTGSITWYDTLGNTLFLEIIRNTSTDPNEPYYVYLNVKISRENLQIWVNSQGWVEESPQEKALRMGLAPAGDPNAYSTILGDPTVYALEDGSLAPTKAAHTLAKQVLEAHTAPSGNRTFLLTAYNAIATHCTPTAEADPSYALQPHEISGSTWLVEFEAEFRYVGSYSPMGYEGDRWHTTLYTGSPVGWLLTKTPTGWILRSRLAPILPQENMAAWVAALSQNSSVLSGDPVRIADAVVEYRPEIESIREEAILWCWAKLYDTRHGNGYVVGPDTVYADASAQSRIQAALLQDLINQEDPDSNVTPGEPEEVFKQLWLYGNQCHSVYLKAMNDGADEPLQSDWFSACSVRYLTMVARLRDPFLRIIATPFEHIAGKKDDVALVWATELFSKVLMQGERPAGVTVSDEASLSDGSFFTEHARWQLAQLRDHIYTLTMTAPDGRILTLTCDAAQNPPR